MSKALLPTSSTIWEGCLADAMPVSGAVQSAITAMRGVKLVSPRVEMLPFLIWEYGLGELTPYVPNLYSLIQEGIAWQRVRGTASSIAIGLAWIGYSATLEEAWTGRRFWNSFQLRFPSLPAQDDPDLERIEGITKLSVPKRSVLRRGVYVYDVGPTEADHTRLDNSMLDFESGIAVTEAGSLWSFGRAVEFTHLFTEADGTLLGNWLAPVVDGALAWSEIDTPWVDANFAWSEDPVIARAILLATWFSGKVSYVRLRDGAGNVIGYRRSRAMRPVSLSPAGVYQIGSDRFDPNDSGSRVYIDAMTQFDDVDGVDCTELALVFNATLAPGVRSGKLWLGPDELVGGDVIAAQAVSIPLRRTVREQFKFMLRF